MYNDHILKNGPIILTIDFILKFFSKENTQCPAPKEFSKFWATHVLLKHCKKKIHSNLWVNICIHFLSFFFKYERKWIIYRGYFILTKSIFSSFHQGKTTLQKLLRCKMTASDMLLVMWIWFIPLLMLSSKCIHIQLI